MIPALLALCIAVPAHAQPGPPREGDFVVRDFRFVSEESLPELRLHYVALGTHARDARGQVTNAVLILHGTGGSGRQFLAPQLADVLFAPGALDSARMYVILPDGIGHGRSSKPSDGLGRPPAGAGRGRSRDRPARPGRPATR